MIGICIHCQCLLNLIEMENGHNECLGCRDPRDEDQLDNYEDDEENGWAER